MYAESLLKSGVDWAELEKRAEALVPSIEAFDPAYVEEMRGIAEGVGADVGRLVAQKLSGSGCPTMIR